MIGPTAAVMNAWGCTAFVRHRVPSLWLGLATTLSLAWLTINHTRQSGQTHAREASQGTSREGIELPPFPFPLLTQLPSADGQVSHSLLISPILSQDLCNFFRLRCGCWWIPGTYLGWKQVTYADAQKTTGLTDGDVETRMRGGRARIDDGTSLTHKAYPLRF